MPLIVAHSRETARVFFHEAEPHAATNPIQFELNSIQAQGKGKGKGNAEDNRTAVAQKNALRQKSAD